MRKRLLALGLSTVLAMGAMSGCAGSSETDMEAETEETAVEEEATPEEEQEASEEASSDTRVVEDSNGNEVTIPSEVTKAAPAIGAFAQMTEMLTGGEGKIVAAATENISDYFKEVFPDYLESNPNNYDAASVEDLIAAGAQVAYGPSSIYSEEQLAQLEAAGIAFVAIDNIATVDGMCQAFTIIGNILGEDEAAKAEEFVQYYKNSITDSEARTENLVDADRKTILNLNYAAGAYSTTNSQDICHEYMTAAGAVNVAADYVGEAAGTALSVDREQIVSWNPDVIIVGSNEGKDAIMSDTALASVTAVQNEDVYVVPTGIYRWNVRSGEGAMMTPWIGTVVYPEQFSDVDMNQIVKDFFNDFYGYELDDAGVEKVLACE